MKHELFYSFSKDTIYHRYFGGLKAMTMKTAARYVNVDYKNEMTIVAVKQNATENIVGIGQYILDPSTDYAEVALAVQDEWQGKGLGTALFNYLMKIAIRRGVKGFTAWILSDNKRMLRLFEKAGYPLKVRAEGNLYHVVMDLKKK
jgi:GNAT superfamily N-acetyltransferase